MEPARAWNRLAAPLLSGGLLAVATPPALSPILPFVALVPLAVHLARLPVERAGARAFEAGALVALIQHAWGLRWLPGTLTAVAGGVTGAAAALAVWLTLAAFGGGAAWCARRLLAGSRPLPLAAALALAWTALDWTLAHLPLGLAFPWAPLGLGLARWPATLGIAELAGVTGVTAWLALVNALIAAAIVVRLERPAARARAGLTLAAAVALAVVPIGWGAWRALDVARYPVLPVIAFALDVPPGGAPQARAEAALAAVESAPLQVTPQLIVLPEMALPLDVDSPDAAALVARLRRWSDGAGSPVLIGTRTSRDGRSFNSAVLLPDLAFRADKRRLVPGAERGSALAPAWLAPSSTGYAPGDGGAVLESGPLAAGVLICWEVAFADDARRLVRGGARALIVLSNDAWFGGARRARAAGVAQQLAHLSMRAIETRSGAVRSANGGPAAEVLPDGRARLEPAPGALVAFLPPASRPTLYLRTGDWIGPLAVAALLLLLALGRGFSGTRLADP